MKNLAGQLAALVPRFKQDIAATTNGRLAELLAFYWFVSLAGGRLREPSADALIGELISELVGAHWSDWGLKRQGEFLVEFKSLCDQLAASKRFAFANGADRATEDDKRTLQIMFAAKTVLAKGNMDDTDPEIVEPLMHHIAALCNSTLPIFSGDSIR